jgi:adenosylhomocysteine nucleosidase
MSARIAIIAALPGELAPLVRGWTQTRKNVWAGSIGDHPSIALAGGMGAAAANRAIDLVRSEFNPNVLVSYGWAGALTCALKPGDAVAVSEVVDVQSGKRFATGSPGTTRLVTMNRVVHGPEKRNLAERNQAVLVDMEAAAVARQAWQHRLPFYCFKGVSDGYTDKLPNFGRFISGDGQLRLPLFLGYVALQPQFWGSLVRLGRQSKRAALALADLARGSLAQSLRSQSL